MTNLLSDMLLHPGRWAGSCDQVVEEFLKTGYEQGIRRDGYWIGKTSGWGWQTPKRYQWRRDAKGRNAIHVWIERPDGSIVDPTRWVFEGVLPYIYRGKADRHYRALPRGERHPFPNDKEKTIA